MSRALALKPDQEDLIWKLWLQSVPQSETDRHNHEKVTSNSDEVEALQILTRMQQRLIWDRQRHVNQLRSLLREFYPGALEALGKDLHAYRRLFTDAYG
jgi:Transposase